MKAYTSALCGSKVQYQYPNTGAPVLKNCSFSFLQGEITCILGENGAGKTTLGKLCAGILQPQQGEILLYGKNLSALRLPEIARSLCYCFQSPSRQLFADTVEEELAFALRFHREPEEKIHHTVARLLLSLIHI